MAETQYIVNEGERWDTIALKAYGRSTMINTIITANPGVPITVRLRAGTVLIIPILTEDTVKTDSELLPPWKRL